MRRRPLHQRRRVEQRDLVRHALAGVAVEPDPAGIDEGPVGAGDRIDHRLHHDAVVAGAVGVPRGGEMDHRLGEVRRPQDRCGPGVQDTFARPGSPAPAPPPRSAPARRRRALRPAAPPPPRARYTRSPRSPRHASPPPCRGEPFVSLPLAGRAIAFGFGTPPSTPFLVTPALSRGPRLPQEAASTVCVERRARSPAAVVDPGSPRQGRVVRDDSCKCDGPALVGEGQGRKRASGIAPTSSPASASRISRWFPRCRRAR